MARYVKLHNGKVKRRKGRDGAHGKTHHKDRFWDLEDRRHLQKCLADAEIVQELEHLDAEVEDGGQRYVPRACPVNGQPVPRNGADVIAIGEPEDGMCLFLLYREGLLCVASVL